MSGCLEKGRTRYSQKTVEQAKALYAEGLSPRAIADRLGVSSDIAVRRWCDDAYRQKHNEYMRLKARGEKIKETVT